MDKQMHKELKWKKSGNRIIVYDQFMWSISWVNCVAASFKMDYLWMCTEWTQPCTYVYPSAIYCGGIKPEYESYNTTVKGMESGGIVSFAHTRFPQSQGTMLLCTIVSEHLLCISVVV